MIDIILGLIVLFILVLLIIGFIAMGFDCLFDGEIIGGLLSVLTGLLILFICLSAVIK